MKQKEVLKSPVLCSNCKSRSFQVLYNYDIELVELICDNCKKEEPFNLRWVL